jgi:hypothetical protein
VSYLVCAARLFIHTLLHTDTPTRLSLPFHQINRFALVFLAFALSCPNNFGFPYNSSYFINKQLRKSNRYNDFNGVMSKPVNNKRALCNKFTDTSEWLRFLWTFIDASDNECSVQYEKFDTYGGAKQDSQFKHLLLRKIEFPCVGWQLLSFFCYGEMFLD